MNDLRVHTDWSFQFVETLQTSAIVAAEIKITLIVEKLIFLYYLLNSSNALAVNEDELMPLEEFDSLIFYLFNGLDGKNK